MVTTQKVQHDLEKARGVANDLISAIVRAGAVNHILIAGSIRREKHTVGDIELLCIPKHGDKPGDMFGNPVGAAPDLLDAVIQGLIAENVLSLRLNKRGNSTYGAENKLLVHVASGIPLDVFSTVAKYWGMALVVRTGPKDFNIRMMSRFRALGLNGHAYEGVTRGDRGHTGFEAWECPDEQVVFDLLKWPYQEPRVRF